MKTERMYDTPQPKAYECIVCHAAVGSESHAIVPDRNTPLPNGRARIVRDGTLWEIWFTPVSRYWCAAGVICGPSCSLKVK